MLHPKTIEALQDKLQELENSLEILKKHHDRTLKSHQAARQAHDEVLEEIKAIQGDLYPSTFQAETMRDADGMRAICTCGWTQLWKVFDGSAEAAASEHLEIAHGIHSRWDTSE